MVHYVAGTTHVFTHRFSRRPIKIKTELGVDVTIDDLEKRIEATFGLDGLIKHLGFESFEKLLVTMVEYQLIPTNGQIIVRLKGDGRAQSSADLHEARRRTKFGQIVMFNSAKGFGFIDDGGPRQRWFRKENVLSEHRARFTGRWQLVEFHPEVTEQGDVAIGIKLLDEHLTLTPNGLIPIEDLREAVRSTVLTVLTERSETSNPITLHELTMLLDSQFRGVGTLARRLGEDRLTSFLRGIEGVSITGTYPALMVNLRDRRSFGRLSPKPKGKKDGEKQNEPQSANFRTIAISIVQASALAGKSMPLSQLGLDLAKKVPGSGTLSDRLGYSSVSKFLRDIPELEVYTAENGVLYVRPKKSQK